MTEFVNPPPQHFAFPAEKTKQLEAAAVARQAQGQPMQRRQPVTMPVNQPQPVQRPQHAGAQQQVPPQQVPPQQVPPQQTYVGHPQDRSGQTPPQFHAVANQMPGFTAPTADPEGASLALPSKFAYYRFKDLYAKPFKGKHLSKLSRAHAEGSLLQLVEVVSSVLSTTTPGMGPLGFELTLPDFYFVLYWLKQNSYTKSNFIHKTQCNNTEHVKQVKEGKLAADTLQIAQIISKSQLTVNELNNLPDPQYFKFNEDVPFYLTPATMRTAIEFSESPKMNSAEREEFEYLAQLGSFVQHKDFLQSPQGYWTLERRAEAMGEADGDEITLIKEFEKALEGYGVDEKINVTCKVCGASRETKVSLDAHSFLSAN
jgi:hypothetical protein